MCAPYTNASDNAEIFACLSNHEKHQKVVRNTHKIAVVMEQQIPILRIFSTSYDPTPCVSLRRRQSMPKHHISVAYFCFFHTQFTSSGIWFRASMANDNTNICLDPARLVLSPASGYSPHLPSPVSTPSMQYRFHFFSSAQINTVTFCYHLRPTLVF